ncbi:MAG TPA: FMN-binding negative transcriptional regulator [Opitutaceae bacterium]|nr:FMN-binding negative transcriptional regulator [Opitutaceae bacterium]
MYTPAHFEEKRPEVLHGLIGAHPLGLLITLGQGGLDANPIPFELAPEPAPFGTLRAHVARANPVWQDFSRDVETLVVFQGPQAYITPSWYVATKPDSGKVVPTWNYCIVHARGPLRVIDDRDWLRALVGRLTARFEAGRAAPWSVADAPADFIEKQLAAIVGIEIPIAKLTGKWKVSQNRAESDRAGVVAGLRAEGTPDAAAMAAQVARPGSILGTTKDH